MAYTRYFILISQVFILSACSSVHVLVDTPNLYASSKAYPSQDIEEVYETTTPELFFMTDRQVENSDNSGNSYGTERSPSIAFGTVKIQFGQNLSWDALEAASSTQTRDEEILLNVADVNEIVRFPETPLPFSVENGKAVILPASSAAYEAATRSVKMQLQDRLEASKQKDILLYVHGVNTKFNDAALNLADVWHFTGRHGVPIFYSWPAANEGLFGYFKDRESGEFSIYHVKETIRILASTPGLEKLHIIAHSRGTDIITTALRELIIEYRAAGKNPRDGLKVQNLILAAPDLDFGVVRQRLIAEKFGLAIGQLTVYMNEDDGALGLSQWLMAGLRFGKLSEDDLSDGDRMIFEQVKNVNFVKVEGISSFVGHSYYRNHPGVLSDISILVRQNLKPGDEGRPLVHQHVNFWTLPENYP
jgi:esterase/lipase superfamily enzyme